jgi:uncharacterized membrane protein
MKYPAHRVSQHLFAAVVFGILTVASAHSTFAQAKQASREANAGQRFSRSSAVPAGIAASDWAGILAAHQAATNNSRLTNAEREAPEAPTTDPIAQQAYAKASNSDANDVFGISVAVSGDTVVIGAFHEDSNATGVNGNQSDNSAIESGAAYVFVRNGTTWTQQAYLKASNTDVNDMFGISVAISGDTIVVGAPFEASNATGVNGNQDDNSAQQAGAAYVFVRNGTTWSQQAYLKASNTDPVDEFGISVAVSGDTVVVGAHYESSVARGVNGDQTDNTACQAGAAYAFVRNGTTWSQQAYLKASNTVAKSSCGMVNAQFGSAVAISGDTIVVGALAEDSNATGINGNEDDHSAFGSGAAYIFARNGTSWSQQAYVKASNTDIFDSFGQSVAVSGDTVVVGAWIESSNATGVNGNQADNSAVQAGAAYVFTRNGTTWSQQAYLKASNTDAHDFFGLSVAASGDTVVVGAYSESSKATGIDGDQTDNSALGAGAAYVFVRSGVTWMQQAYLKASNTDANDFFGRSVAVSGDTVVVGAFTESSNANGINGDQSDDSAPGAGAAYVFTGLGSPSSIPLLNISTRMNVGTGDNVLIGGFIVVGTEPKKVLLRAIGPSLTAFGVLNALADPIIELHKPGNIVVTNDNWMDTQEQEIMATGIAPTDPLESAILATLDPNAAYTAIVRGKNDGTGVGLVEVYDLDQAADSELANISTRGFVDIDENVMIGGFIVGSGVNTTVVVRAIGPSLGAVGIANPLLNPTLELHDTDGTQIAFDDDWKETQQAEIEAAGLAPTDDRESAIEAVLTPGLYTAIVRGKDNTTGVGLMEVYNLP